jgi:hypothetical protein
MFLKLLVVSTNTQLGMFISDLSDVMAFSWLTDFTNFMLVRLVGAGQQLALWLRSLLPR